MGNKITRRRPVIDERYTRPQGLYPHRDVDQRKLRRLILESKLAPCFPGAEEPATDLEECPICFLHYPSLNRSKCCTKGICTECFLQMKSPHVARPTQCPFCKTPNYAVEYRGAKTLEEKGMEQAEEQKVIEAKIRMRQQELQDDDEREQRRQEDIRAGRIAVQPPRAQAITNHQIANAPVDEIDGLNWRSGWGSADRQSQALTSSAPLERTASAIDPYSLWVDESYRRPGGFEAAAPSQQIAASVVSNPVPPTHQQPTETGFPIPQAPPGAIRGRHNREDEFDLDLEDIMVMEAIWLSIQEQGAHHRFADGEATRSLPNRPSGQLTEISLGSDSDGDTAILPPPPPPAPQVESWDQHSGRQGTTAGGLAGAIAALAERQAVGAPAPASQATSVNPLPPYTVENRSVGHVSDVDVDASESAGSDDPVSLSTGRRQSSVEGRQRGEGAPAELVVSVSGREDDAENSSGASEKLANWVSSTQKEYKGSSTWLGDQSSEQVEVGTSFSSSVPSASELPWEAPEDARNGESSGGANNDKVLVPDSFEEQMMLAMALSLADAQARGRAGRSGPLPRSTAHVADIQARMPQGNSRSGPLPRPTYIGH
ncbi:hypothetical protein KC19_1G292900 [Ceratodon purpureus]|uniref:RING-type domain-containing protein n=1 Tax=Ceratodon purpureus TaxID=3225 RepID=A0A8T0JD53_CERPU|nr:hypothetical protein KC19_1G292900 [Ceratodon purpureus]